jgi:hypothetical protein
MGKGMFEAVEFIEHRPGDQAEVKTLGSWDSFDLAVEAARAAWKLFERTGGNEYAWWVVREPGAQLARWIADNHSHREFVVDLRSGELIELR